MSEPVSILDLMREGRTLPPPGDDPYSEPRPEAHDAPVRLEHVSGRTGPYVGRYRICRGNGLLATIRCSEHVARRIVMLLNLAPIYHEQENIPSDVARLLPETHDPGESANAEHD